MKQRLLSLIAMVAFAVVAFAQTTWTPPLPDASQAATLNSSDKDTVYLYNVGAAQFLFKGADWGTQAAVNATSAFSTILTSYADEANDAEYWRIFLVESKNKKYLFNNDGAYCFTDLNNQDVATSYWTITQDANKIVHIQSYIYGTYGESLAGKYFGYCPSRADIDHSGNDLGTHIAVWGDVDPNEEDAHIDWLIFTKATFDAWNATNSVKLQLLNLINTAEEIGVDVSSAVAVLNNNSATVEQVEDAITALKTKIVESMAGEASEENPVDVTSVFIVNPDFTGKSTSGWTLTGSYAKTQDNSPHYIQDDEGTNTDEIGLDSSPGGWLEFWKSGGIDADQDAHQVINDLPAGQYRLQLDGIGLGGQLYAITNGIEQTAPLGRYLQHVNFDFLHVGGDLTFGFKFTPTESVAWVAVDNFRLFYLGEGDNPMLIILKNAMNTVEPYYLQTTDDAFSSALYDELSTVYANAQTLIETSSTDEEASKAAIDAINDVRTRILAESASYEKMRVLVEMTAENDVEKYLARSKKDGDGYEKLCTTIETLVEGFQDKLNDRSYNSEAINADIEAYNQAIKDGMAVVRSEIKAELDAAVASGKALDENLDITDLFEGMEIVYSSSARNYPNLPDTLWQNATGTTDFKTQYGTAEVWNATSFDIYREVSLPKGKYTVTANAFYREASSSSNYANYMADAITGYSYIYAGNNQTLLYNMANLVTSEEVSGWYNIAGEDEEPLYQPNSQQAAHGAFNTEPYATQTLNTVSTVLSDAGTLRFGFKSGEGLQDDQWTVWENVRIYYNIATASDYNPELAQLIERANEISMDGAGGVQAALEKLEKATADGDKALDSNDTNTKSAAITQLVEAINYAEKGAELAQEITELFTTYQEKFSDPENDIVSNYDAFPALLETIDAAVLVEEFESNEQIQGWIDSLPIEWTRYLLGWDELDNATAENPVDLSMMLVNTTFDNNDKAGWTVEAESVGGTDADGCIEFWQSSPFDIYQTLVELRPGVYRLSVNALYRAGSSEDETGAVNAADSIPVNEMYLYAGTEQVKVVQWSDFERGALTGTLALNQEEYPELAGTDYALADATDFCAPNTRSAFQTFIQAGRYMNELTFEYREGQGEIRLGIRKTQAVGNDWAPIDNFCLEYLGADPNGIRGINAGTNNAGNAIYNLAGQKVTRMQKGIYVVNGQKVAVK